MSAIHSLLRRFPFTLSGRTLSSSGLYTPSTYTFDYALGGVPFLSATGDTRPDTTSSVPQRKDQFDSYKDPGEYSLNQWWLRSQSSFVGGAGVLYQDPDTQGQSLNIRFNKSVGIDPFSDIDNIQLLRRVVDFQVADPDTVVGKAFAQAYSGGSGNDLWFAKGRHVYNYLVTPSSLTLRGSVALGGSSGQIIQGVVSIDKRLDTASTANYGFVFFEDFGGTLTHGIYRVDEATISATRIYQMPDTLDYNGCLAKAKGLLAFGRANKFYMLDPYVAADTALPTENAQVPQDQNIVDATDGPDGVYVAANSGTQGYIYKSTQDAAGIVNGLQLVAVLPAGEMINNIAAYVATYLVITTDSGIRVGNFTGGQIAYGPPLLTVDPATGGFGRIAFWGTNAYVATIGTPQHDSSKGLMCVSLANIVTDNNAQANFNAYSTWTYFPGNTSIINDVTVTTDGRTVQTATTTSLSHIYLEHATELLDMGYLDTGRCRFNTIEPKLFKYFSIKTPVPLEGEVSVAVLTDTGGIVNYINYGPTLDPGTGDISTPDPAGPRNYESLRFTLRRNPGDATKGGKLDSWQIKALPGNLRQRMLVRQFSCFNGEKDKSGQQLGGDTWAQDRLLAVEQMCQRGDTVILQDIAQNTATQVIIDDFTFTMLTTPGPNKENFGGYLTVKLRTVADAVPPFNNSGSAVEE